MGAQKRLHIFSQCVIFNIPDVLRQLSYLRDRVEVTGLDQIRFISIYMYAGTWVQTHPRSLARQRWLVNPSEQFFHISYAAVSWAMIAFREQIPGPRHH
jgi:hypothetical protein